MMSYDLDNLIAELGALPASYQWVGSDVGRGRWSVIRNLLELEILSRNSLSSQPGAAATSMSSGAEGIK
jgi:hypothetical protein